MCPGLCEEALRVSRIVALYETLARKTRAGLAAETRGGVLTKVTL